MPVIKKSGAPPINRTLWEHAYRYIFLQYPDPAVAKAFLLEALRKVALSQKSKMRWRKGRSQDLARDQHQATAPIPDLAQPPLYTTPEAVMPEAWRLLFVLSTVCATRGKELEARVSPSSEDLLARYVTYLLYLTMKKPPDDRALVWGSLLMSYTPSEVQNLITNTNSSFRKRKRWYLDQVQKRFAIRTRKGDHHTIIRGHAATFAEVQFIGMVAQKFCAWLWLFDHPQRKSACPLFPQNLRLSAEVFSDVALQKQRDEKRAEIEKAQYPRRQGSPLPSPRELARRVEIALQWPLFEELRHVLACPECAGFARLVEEWRDMLTPAKGREQFETEQNKKERQKWAAEAMKPRNKMIVPNFANRTGGTQSGPTRGEFSRFSPPPLTESDLQHIQAKLSQNQRRRAAFMATGPLHVLVAGRGRA